MLYYNILHNDTEKHQTLHKYIDYEYILECIEGCSRWKMQIIYRYKLQNWCSAKNWKQILYRTSQMCVSVYIVETFFLVQMISNPLSDKIFFLFWQIRMERYSHLKYCIKYNSDICVVYLLRYFPRQLTIE